MSFELQILSWADTSRDYESVGCELQAAMVKFSRSAVQELLAELETPAEVELLVTGELGDGTLFEGTDTIKVIDKGGRE